MIITSQQSGGELFSFMSRNRGRAVVGALALTRNECAILKLQLNTHNRISNQKSMINNQRRVQSMNKTTTKSSVASEMNGTKMSSSSSSSLARRSQANNQKQRQQQNKRQQQQQQNKHKQQRAAYLEANESFRYKNILSARSVPIVFILVCFLIIANSRCDSVGSTNVIEETTTIESSQDKLKAAETLANLNAKDLELEALEQQVANAKAKQAQKHVNKALAKLDPLSMLREIYLDHNSKVITMLPESDTVQKFHPNGRYGRSSVDNYVEPHAELGKLIYDDQLDSARSLANNRVRPSGAATASSDSYALRTILRSIGRVAPPTPVTPATSTRYSTASGGTASNSSPPQGVNNNNNNNIFSSNGAQVANYQLEMNKLLKCNYTGISNLYWCDTTTSAA